MQCPGRKSSLRQPGHSAFRARARPEWVLTCRSLYIALATTAITVLNACTEETESIPYAAVTEVRETIDGRLLVAGYSSPDLSELKRGFIEILADDESLDDFTGHLRAGDIPEELNVPPIWGVTECEEGEFAAVTGNWAPFSVVRGPDWKVEALPDAWALVSVEALGCDDVVAVGRKKAADSEAVVGVIARFDGEEWTEMKIPEDTPPLVELWRGDFGSFAVGDEGTILSLTDEVWGEMDTPTDANLRAVWGSSERVFAVGGAASEEYVVLEYDGKDWSIVAEGDGTLLAVHGLADDDVYAVGGYSDSSSGSARCTVLHFDGTEWKSVSCSHPDLFWEVWELSDGQAIAGGNNSTLLQVSE